MLYSLDKTLDSEPQDRLRLGPPGPRTAILSFAFPTLPHRGRDFLVARPLRATWCVAPALTLDIASGETEYSLPIDRLTRLLVSDYFPQARQCPGPVTLCSSFSAQNCPAGLVLADEATELGGTLSAQGPAVRARQHLGRPLFCLPF